jgi:hypothetical protein
MRNVLALIGLAVVGFAGVGWYLGWYKLTFSKHTDGNLQIKTDVDTKKVGSDSGEFLKNVGAVIGGHVDKAAQDAKTTAPATTPGTTPGPVTPPQNVQPDPNTPFLPTIPIAPPPAPKGNSGTIPLVTPRPN